jgi:hypothetical protein
MTEMTGVPAGAGASNAHALEPFEFSTADYLTRIGNEIAVTLSDLQNGLKLCSDASIFHHTFQTLGRHHFLTEGFSNDFAQWVLAATSRSELAEQLATIDVRDYVSIAELRSDLLRVVGDYCTGHAQLAAQTALEPFYFCESVEVALPLDIAATTLEEFRRRVETLSHASLYYHFIAARTRLGFRTNDFSFWLANQVGLRDLAERINRIDIYTNTLDSARAEMLRLVAQRELAS